ncbi:MAG: hypothetical protein NWQ52_02910 [Algoriphagus sp.]|nr:hypothetical protein [Algoriphagus sp.]
MRSLYQLFVFLGCCWIGLLQVKAQSTPKGGIKDQEFIIQKDRIIRLPKRLRAFEKAPVLPQGKPLQITNFPVAPFFLKIPAPAVAAQASPWDVQLPKSDQYPGFVRIGYGNFLAPMVEGRYSSTQTEDWQFATKVVHQSYGKGPVSWMGQESKESQTKVIGDVSYFMDQAEVFSNLSLKRAAYTFYGEDLGFSYPPNVDVVGPFFSANRQLQGDFSVGIRDLEKVGPIGYEASVLLSGFQDSYSVREKELGFHATGSLRPSKVLQGTIGVSLVTSDTKDREYDLNRTYFSLQPEVNYKWNKYQFTAGAVIVADNDSLAERKSDFRLFPVLKSTYQVKEDLSIFASISGKVDRATYRSFVAENPFLGPSEQLLNTVTKLSFEAGVESVVSDKLFYRAGIDLRRQSNLHFYVNSAADTSRFELVYDEKATVFRVNSSVELILSEKYSVNTHAEVIHYGLETQQEAWHRPTWLVRMNHRMVPTKKLILQANLQAMGGLKARGIGGLYTLPVQVEVIKLPVLLDLHLHVDYALTSRLTVFANGHNLLNRSNSRWMNYPVRGTQGLGGLSFKF